MYSIVGDKASRTKTTEISPEVLMDEPEAKVPPTEASDPSSSVKDPVPDHPMEDVSLSDRPRPQGMSNTIEAREKIINKEKKEQDLNVF